ncbi:hypothetical protein QYF36_017380 [Acer negundo]|nr:hypothetical protein QYF36_017380 [Acer negundo]
MQNDSNRASSSPYESAFPPEIVQNFTPRPPPSESSQINNGPKASLSAAQNTQNSVMSSVNDQHFPMSPGLFALVSSFFGSITYTRDNGCME